MPDSLGQGPQNAIVAPFVTVPRNVTVLNNKCKTPAGNEELQRGQFYPARHCTGRDLEESLEREDATNLGDGPRCRR